MNVRYGYSTRDRIEVVTCPLKEFVMVYGYIIGGMFVAPSPRVLLDKHKIGTLNGRKSGSNDV